MFLDLDQMSPHSLNLEESMKSKSSVESVDLQKWPQTLTDHSGLNLSNNGLLKVNHLHTLVKSAKRLEKKRTSQLLLILEVLLSEFQRKYSAS